MSRCRVVLDTNVLVSALLSPTGNPAKIYRMVLTGVLDLVVAADIIEEYRDVLARPRLGIPAQDSATVLTVIHHHAQHINPRPSTGPMPDEDDRIFYDTAKSASAYLVTGNTKHYPSEPIIVTPTEFLRLPDRTAADVI